MAGWRLSDGQKLWPDL